MAVNPDTLPELIAVDESDPAAARRIRRLAADGRLRRLHAGIYTSNLDAPPEAVTLRHWHQIVGHLLPGGVISHLLASDPRRYLENLTRGRGWSGRVLPLDTIIGALLGTQAARHLTAQQALARRGARTSSRQSWFQARCVKASPGSRLSVIPSRGPS